MAHPQKNTTPSMSYEHPLARQIITTASNASLTIATAESCTGGLVAKLLTDVAGSSAVLECGFVTYSNNAKVRMLGVKTSTLENHGAVSEAVVEEMALGAQNYSSAQISVAISGIAGPGGAAPNKPVGTVCLSFCLNKTLLNTTTLHLEGDRESIRQQAADYALKILLNIAAQ